MEHPITKAILEISKNQNLALRKKEGLASWTTFCCHGQADAIASPKNAKGLQEILQIFSKIGLLWKKEWDILGRGSNVLFSDQGYRGILIDLSLAYSDICVEKEFQEGLAVEVGAGVANGTLLQWTREKSLTGFEFAFGIPGSVGGGICMNAGTPQGWFGEVTKRVRGYAPDGKFVELEVGPEDFRYRSFDSSREMVITSGLMHFLYSSREEIEKKINVSKTNRQRQPLELPNIGSVFKNPDGDYAARLIEACGLKGTQSGNAQISEKHSNFIVNLGGASAQDVLSLIHQVQKTVESQHNVRLETEVQLLGEFL